MFNVARHPPSHKGDSQPFFSFSWLKSSRLVSCTTCHQSRGRYLNAALHIGVSLSTVQTASRSCFPADSCSDTPSHPTFSLYLTTPQPPLLTCYVSLKNPQPSLLLLPLPSYDELTLLYGSWGCASGILHPEGKMIYTCECRASGTYLPRQQRQRGLFSNVGDALNLWPMNHCTSPPPAYLGLSNATNECHRCPCGCTDAEKFRYSQRLS